MAGNGPSPVSKAEMNARGSKRGRNRAGDLAGAIVIGAPKMPAGLAGEARREWRRVVPALARAGAISPVDRAHLQALCMAWSEFVELGLAAELIFAELFMSNGDLINWRRIVGTRNEAWSRYASIARKFGLNPEDRTRVKIPTPEEKPTSRVHKFKLVGA